ncbi:hypothetical protein [Deinococcus humi]|uniref:Uncharacterized protein n=1 Tax=Deinococcus humi TaxID=662880 RepID=A0A7W8NGK1_9DEIO|nr:hypothetical protein [Deinococcus humi]MBB5363062.1 hypothetical protein [Deinococcus humi]GGO24900.1 hypothetical protein GCM10008949_14230 [Deinococcus humi]
MSAFGVTVLERQQEGKKILLAYRASGRPISAKVCEDIGEDHGFYDPRTEPTLTLGAYVGARIIREGFTGELCEHRWDMVAHFSRNPYGYVRTCGKCGITTMESHKKRSNTGTYTYGEWELREHIWRKWMNLGPVPGSLVAQPHHGKGEEADPRQEHGGTSTETLDERLKSLRPGLPCCGEYGACTGGSGCWADEPDNIPEGL